MRWSDDDSLAIKSKLNRTSRFTRSILGGLRHSFLRRLSALALLRNGYKGSAWLVKGSNNKKANRYFTQD